MGGKQQGCLTGGNFVIGGGGHNAAGYQINQTRIDTKGQKLWRVRLVCSTQSLGQVGIGEPAFGHEKRINKWSLQCVKRMIKTAFGTQCSGSDPPAWQSR